MNQFCEQCQQEKDSLYFQNGRSRRCNECVKQKSSTWVQVAPPPKPITIQQAKCHPSERNKAKGLCSSCYQQARKANARKVNNEYQPSN